MFVDKKIVGVPIKLHTLKRDRSSSSVLFQTRERSNKRISGLKVSTELIRLLNEVKGPYTFIPLRDKSFFKSIATIDCSSNNRIEFMILPSNAKKRKTKDIEAIEVASLAS